MDSSVIQACLFYMCMYYILILIMYWCCGQIFCRREPVVVDAIQLDNVRNVTRINSDLQRCLVPINVLNTMGYEYNITYNPLLEQSHQQSNAAQNVRMNVPTTQSSIVPLSSDLNYLDLDTFDVTSSSRPLMDDPPPPYEECTKNSSSCY